MAIELEQVAVEQLAQQGGAVEHRRIADGHQAVEGPVQGLARGAHAVAVLGHVVDHATAGQARRQQAETAAQAAGTRCTDNRRNARQRHVVTDVQVAADADAGHVLGQAQAIHVDVVGVGELIGRGLQRVVEVADRALEAGGRRAERAARYRQAAGVEPGLGEDFGGLAVVEAQGSAQPLGRPLGHYAPVAALVRGQVMTTANGGQCPSHRDQPGGTGMAEEEALGALAHQVRAAIVGAGFRQAGCVPVQEVLGADGQLRVHQERGGQLIARYEQLFGFGAGRGRELGQVQARLAIAERVHRVEQGLTPEQVVLAQLAAQLRVLTDVGAHEHECIEHFAGRAAVVALGVVAQVRAAQWRAGTWQAIEARVDAGGVTVAVDERVGIGAGVVIGLVVPTGGTDTKAHVALVDHVQLGEQVYPVGDVGTGLAKVVVAIVVVRRGEHALVGAFSANAVVVLDGVVQAHGPVFTAGIDFKRLGTWQCEQADGAGQQTALWLHSTVGAMF
ncbi:hypothetical protein D3C77_307100 [compost metagenome]